MLPKTAAVVSSGCLLTQLVQTARHHHGAFRINVEPGLDDATCDGQDINAPNVQRDSHSLHAFGATCDQALGKS